MLFDWLINLSTSILCFVHLYPLHQPDPVNIVQQLGLTAYEEGDDT